MDSSAHAHPNYNTGTHSHIATAQQRRHRKRLYNPYGSIAAFSRSIAAFTYFVMICLILKPFVKVLRACPSSILKDLVFTISKTNFITYNTPLYNIPYIKTSIFLTLHLNIISLLIFYSFSLYLSLLCVSLSQSSAVRSTHTTTTTSNHPYHNHHIHPPSPPPTRSTTTTNNNGEKKKKTSTSTHHCCH